MTSEKPIRVNRMKQPINGYGALVLLVVCLTLAGLGLQVALSANNRSDLKFCAIVGGAHRSATERVAGYEAAPPSTAAGRAQQQQAIQSERNWAELERALNCPPSLTGE